MHIEGAAEVLGIKAYVNIRVNNKGLKFFVEGPIFGGIFQAKILFQINAGSKELGDSASIETESLSDAGKSLLERANKKIKRKLMKAKKKAKRKAKRAVKWTRNKLKKAFISFKAQLIPGPLFGFIKKIGKIVKKAAKKIVDLAKKLKKAVDKIKKKLKKFGIGEEEDWKVRSLEEDCQMVYDQDERLRLMKEEGQTQLGEPMYKKGRRLSISYGQLGEDDETSLDDRAHGLFAGGLVKGISKGVSGMAKGIAKGASVVANGVKNGVMAGVNALKKALKKVLNKFKEAARAAKGLFALMKAIAKGGFKKVFYPCGAGFEARLSASNMIARLKMQVLLFGKRQTFELKVTFNSPAKTIKDNLKVIKNLVFGIFKTGGKRSKDKCNFKFFDVKPPNKPKSVQFNLPNPDAVKKQQNSLVENPPKMKWNTRAKPESRRAVRRKLRALEKRADKKEEVEDRKEVQKEIEKDVKDGTCKKSYAFRSRNCPKATCPKATTYKLASLVTKHKRQLAKAARTKATIDKLAALAMPEAVAVGNTEMLELLRKLQKES